MEININQTTRETRTVQSTVYEHRAPTDDSVRLLKEMQEAVEKNRLMSATLDPNLFGGKIILQNEPMTGDIAALCLFELNGKRMKAVFRMAMGTNFKAEALLIGLRNEVATMIAGELLSNFIDGDLSRNLGALTKHRLR